MRTTTSSLQGCYEYSGLPPRFIADRYDDLPEIGDGVFLTGRPGTHKTLKAVGMAKRLIDSTYRKDERMGCYRVASVRFLTVNGLLDAYRATYSDGTPSTEEEVTRRFASCDLLVIDDLGKEVPTEWAVSKLFDVVNARYERALPIVVTSQLDQAELIAHMEKGGSETAVAIVSRLCEMCRTVKTEGPDRRMSCK